MKLDIIECKGCGLLYSDENYSIKRLYQEKDGSGHHAQYLDCRVCSHKTMIFKDYTFSYAYLSKLFGENKFSDLDD